MKMIRKRLSSRFHLALGLASLVASLLLGATWLGLVPDRDGALRAGRLSLAESVAIGVTSLLEDERADDPRIARLLRFIGERNPDLLSIGLRRADGALLLQTGEHVARWREPRGEESSDDGQVTVPVLQGSERWGRLELRFAPLHGGGDAWWSALTAPAMKLVGAMALACFALFYLYLRRMLRHLDPSRAIPARVRTAFDTLAEGLLVLDTEGRIVLANRAFCDVAGAQGDALVGKSAATLAWTNQAKARVHADELPWARALAKVQLVHNQLLYLVDAAGKRRSFMVNGSPVPGAQGKPAGVLVSFDDVTELEAKEIELRLARDAADAANRAKSDFLANMSHEIRTPMNAILGYTELLRRGYASSAREAAKHLDVIHGSGKHLLGLINDILDLSKVEAGRLEVERIDCAAHQVVHEVVRAMKVKADENGVALELRCAQALPARIATDPARLRQIVTNLIGNALKFTEQGGVTVTLSMRRMADPAQLVIEIADSGIGIAEDKLEAIFEPFVQAEASTTRQFGGTGLGLAISRRFARALGGDIVATSRPGAGSTFHVTIEAGVLDDVEWLEPAQLLAARESPAEVDSTSWRFPPKRVLVVDDGAENRQLVRLVLEPVGLAVLEAENGALALERLAADLTIELVLMDVQMPVMDGYTATRALRERGCTLPVLALTANAMKGFERQIEAAGFSGYLTKPVDIDALLAELAQRLGGQREERPADAPAAVTAEVAAVAAPAPAAAAPIVSRLVRHPRLAKVARNFALQLPGRLQAMRDALDAGDLAELAQLAHWLKGAGGTVGFDAFFEPALELEGLAKQGDRAAIGVALSELQALAARIVVPDDEPALVN